MARGEILISREMAIGDVLMTTPIVRAVKEKYPNTPIIYETKCPQLLHGNPYIKRIVESAPGTFDIKIRPRYEDSFNENAIDAMAKTSGVKIDSRRMEIYLPTEPMPDFGGPFVVVHTGKSWISRTWPIDRFVMVMSWIVTHGYRVIIVGNEVTDLVHWPGVFDMRGVSFALVTSFMRIASFFVGIDSAPANIAKAVGCPAFVIYGCVHPETRYADSTEYPIWAGHLECAGCRNKTSATSVECRYEGDSGRTPRCLTEITPEMVIDEIKRRMNL